MSRQLLALLLVVLAASCGCTARRFQGAIEKGKASRMLPRFADCPDNGPVRLLVDEHCPGGVCGYSCDPLRWRMVCLPEGGSE